VKEAFQRALFIAGLTFLLGGLTQPLAAQEEDERIGTIKAILYQNPDSAEAICLEMLEEQETLSSSDLLQVHRFMGILFDLKGAYEASLNAYDMILNTTIGIDDSIHWANALLGKGVVYHRLGQFDKALEHYRRSQKYYDQNALVDRSRAVLGNIAALYNNLGLYQEAIDIYRLQLNEPETQNDTNNCAGIYLNLANSFEQKGALDSAIYYNKRSIELYQAINNYYSLGPAFHTKGTLFRHLGMLDSALSYYERCISPVPGIYFKSDEPAILILMAETYALQQKQDMALVYLDSAHHLIENEDEKLANIEAIKELEARIWEERGDTKKASAAWKAAHEVSQKMNKQDLDAWLLRFSEETKAVYYKNVLDKTSAENSALVSENERKAKYIFWILLCGIVLVAGLIAFYVAWLNHARYNRILSERNEDLDSHLRTKKQLLSLLAHDFRSPLNSMNAMLDFIDKDELSMEQRKTFVNRARRHIQTTLRGMDQMLVWINRDKKKPSIQQVELAPMLSQLVDFFHLKLEDKKMRVNYEDLEGSSMQFDHGNLEAIVRNILSNCIKYCPQNAQIDVNFSRTETEETLSIHDNGPGIDPSTLELIQSKKFNEIQPNGSTRTKSTGVGMELIFDLASLNGASVVVDSTPNQGTSISIIRSLD
jgi:signal transduction histidine kinase